MARVFEATSAADTFGFIRQHGGSIFNATRSLLDSGVSSAGETYRTPASGGLPTGPAADLAAGAARRTAAGFDTTDPNRVQNRVTIDTQGPRSVARPPRVPGQNIRNQPTERAQQGTPNTVPGLSANQTREYNRLIGKGVPFQIARTQASTFAKKDLGDIAKGILSPIFDIYGEAARESQGTGLGFSTAEQREGRNSPEALAASAGRKLGLRGEALNQWVKDNADDFESVAVRGTDTSGLVVPTEPGTDPTPAEVGKWKGEDHPTRGEWVGMRLDTATGNLIPTWAKDLRSGLDTAFTLTDPTTGEEQYAISFTNMASSVRYTGQALWYAGQALGAGDVGLWEKRRPNMIAGPVADQLRGSFMSVLDPATGEPYEDAAGLMAHFGYRLTDTGWWVKDIPAAVGGSNNYLATLGGYGGRSYYTGGGGGSRTTPRSDGRYNWHIQITA